MVDPRSHLAAIMLGQRSNPAPNLNNSSSAGPINSLTPPNSSQVGGANKNAQMMSLLATLMLNKRLQQGKVNKPPALRPTGDRMSSLAAMQLGLKNRY